MSLGYAVSFLSLLYKNEPKIKVVKQGLIRMFD